MNHIQAAVLWPGTDTLSIETLELEDPREGEVLVRIVASGICHSDMVLRNASITTRPVVLGHEGAGIVEKVGVGVSDFTPGDRVAMSYATCGECPSCQKENPAYCFQFVPLNFTGRRPDGSTSLTKDGQVIGSHICGQSAFASHAICSQRSLVKVDDSVPLELVAPFGCGFQTGAGAVLNSLKVPETSSVMVLGAGAVGLSAVMAAAYIAGATTVIAVDRHESRLDLALTVGATHAIQGASANFVSEIQKICPLGVDYIFDTTAYLPLIEQCVPLLATQGSLGLVAAYPLDAELRFPVSAFTTSGRKIQGVMGGDSDIRRFIPLLLDYYRRGLFPVDKLVRYYNLDEINLAIEASERGETIKAIVRMPV